MNTTVRNAAGERLDHAFHPAVLASQKHRVVLVGHGVTGNMDRPWAVALAEACAAAGIDAIRFSFSGNGNSEGRFVDSTITKEVADLGSLLDALPSHYTDVIYAGHSMGGAVGVLRAAADPRITHLVSLAGMVHTKRFVEAEFGDVVPDRGVMWDKPECPLSSTYVSDLIAIGSVLDRAPSIRVPWLLVHGTEDDVVPVGESREIFAAAREPKQLVELPGCDHVFSDEGVVAMTRAVVGFLS
jgi:pimeloyl-ACP methyl ester carboxylesterase